MTTAPPCPASPDLVRERLARQGITTSVTTATSTRLDFERRDLPDLVRASVHYVTTPDELRRLVEEVATIRRSGRDA